MSDQRKRTELQELGEFGLIEKIKSESSLRNQQSVLGIGDDAAIIEVDEGHQLVATTDLLVEGVHFDLGYMPIKHLGYKAVAVNVSDVAAMNAFPKQVTISIAVSSRFSLEAIEEFYRGVNAACENFNVDLVGGDTSTSASGLMISVTALGHVEKDKAVLRSGAKEKDIVCATGDLGGAYLGLQVLEREKQVFLQNPEMQPKLDGYDYIVQRQLKPEARMDIIYDLQDHNLLPTSMIDISDGLASDLLHICSSSKKGVRIFEDKIPIDQKTYETAVEFNMSPITAAMNGGEDYELLFTINQSDFEKIEKHPDIHFIGYIEAEEQGCNLVTKAETLVPITAQGWAHFNQE